MKYDKDEEKKKLLSEVNTKLSKEEIDLLSQLIDKLDISLKLAQLATKQANSPLLFQLHRILRKIIDNDKKLDLIFNKILEQGEKSKCKQEAAQIKQILEDIYKLIHAKKNNQSEIPRQIMVKYIRNFIKLLRDETIPIYLAASYDADLRNARKGKENAPPTQFRMPTLINKVQRFEL